MDSNMSPDELVTAMKVACARAHQLQTLCELAGLDPDSEIPPGSREAAEELELREYSTGHELEEPYFWNKEDPLCPRF